MDLEKQFVLNLEFQLELENRTTEYSILSNTSIPIPVCHENVTYTLPGDGTIAAFSKMVGKSFTPAAIDVILYQLGLKV